MRGARLRADRQFATVRITAWAYACFFLILCPAYFLTQPVGRHASVGSICIGCLAWALAALSVIRRSWVGFYVCLFISTFMLFAPPIGTILGWNMIRALQRNWAQFGRKKRQRA